MLELRRLAARTSSGTTLRFWRRTSIFVVLVIVASIPRAVAESGPLCRAGCSDATCGEVQCSLCTACGGDEPVPADDDDEIVPGLTNRDFWYIVIGGIGGLIALCIFGCFMCCCRKSTVVVQQGYGANQASVAVQQSQTQASGGAYTQLPAYDPSAMPAVATVPVVATCTSCRQPLPARMKFCSQCGAQQM